MFAIDGMMPLGVSEKTKFGIDTVRARLGEVRRYLQRGQFRIARGLVIDLLRWQVERHRLARRERRDQHEDGWQPAHDGAPWRANHPDPIDPGPLGQPLAGPVQNRLVRQTITGERPGQGQIDAGINLHGAVGLEDPP